MVAFFGYHPSHGVKTPAIAMLGRASNPDLNEIP